MMLQRYVALKKIEENKKISAFTSMIEAHEEIYYILSSANPDTPPQSGLECQNIKELCENSKSDICDRLQVVGYTSEIISDSRKKIVNRDCCPTDTQN